MPIAGSRFSVRTHTEQFVFLDCHWGGSTPETDINPHSLDDAGGDGIIFRALCFIERGTMLNRAAIALEALW